MSSARQLTPGFPCCSVPATLLGEASAWRQSLWFKGRLWQQQEEGTFVLHPYCRHHWLPMQSLPSHVCT